MSPADTCKLLRIFESYPKDLLPEIGEGKGKVAPTSAYQLARLADEHQIRNLHGQVIRDRLTRDEVTEEVNNLLGGKKQKAKPVKGKGQGFAVEFNCEDVKKAREAVAKLDAALARMEKMSMPLDMLPQFLKNPPQP